MLLLKFALLPAAILLFYVYSRDKYEKEPIWLFVTGIVMGMVSIGPVLGLDLWLMRDFTGLKGVFYSAFVTSAFTEESMKLLFLVLLTFRNPEINNSMDGIIYAVAVSLGFAAAENLIYVFDPLRGGFQTALMRSVFSVPAHCVFGIAMGSYYERAIFEKRKKDYILTFLAPFLMHGIYNFILLMNLDYYAVIFIPYIVYLYKYGLKNIENRFKKQTT